MSYTNSGQDQLETILLTFGGVDELEFDEDFLQHMAAPSRQYTKHRVSLEEIVEAHEQSPKYLLNEGRDKRAALVMVGPTDSGRIIVVPIEPAGKWARWRPITAFAANAKGQKTLFCELSVERRAKSEEQRTKSKEQRAKNKERRAKSKEQRAKNKEQRAKSKDRKEKRAMNRTSRQDYVLGKDVTDAVRGQSRGTVVLSLRVDSKEFATLSRLADVEGKTVSQLVREGIRARLNRADMTPSNRMSFTFLLGNGAEASFGARLQSTKNPWPMEASSESSKFLIGDSYCLGPYDAYCASMA